MAFNPDTSKNPLHDQIAEMQRKIQLLEGDRAAYYESSQNTIKKNTELIHQLKQENKKLYKRVAEANAGDEHIINMAFQNRGFEKDAYRNMSVKEALTTLDQKVLFKVNRLNALKYSTQTCQERLDELKTKYFRMKPEGNNGAQYASARAQKKEEDAMKLQALENNLEKTQFKSKEAESILTNYQTLKSHLLDESLTFQGQLDSLESEILRYKEELNCLQVMNTEADLSAKYAKTELQLEEELLHRERKEREISIANYKRRVEEGKALAERVERRAQKTGTELDEMIREALHTSSRLTGDDEKTLSGFEEALSQITEATGVSNAQEIEGRFISQKQTHEQLERLKSENEKILQQLKEQKEDLNQQFEDIKYSGEAKLSSDQQVLLECDQQLQTEKKKCEAAKEHLDWLVKTLNTVRAGVEHLAEKLQHITLGEDKAYEVSPDSDDFLVELLRQCELKLQQLREKLHGKDFPAIRKEMEEEEFSGRIEAKVPSYNTRVQLAEDQRIDLFSDEDKSEDDEADIISREALKRQSQMINESQTKKKPKKKRKGRY